MLENWSRVLKYWKYGEFKGVLLSVSAFSSVVCITAGDVLSGSTVSVAKRAVAGEHCLIKFCLYDIMLKTNSSYVSSCLRELSGLTSLKSLNLDARQITDAGLAALTSLTGLTHLDLFGARITDSGTSHLRNLKNLRSLEICGGGLTDAGVKNIKDLSSLSLLNLSQNCNLTDKTLEMISGIDVTLYFVIFPCRREVVENDKMVDRIDLFERFKFPCDKCRIETSKAPEELKISDLGGLQGHSK
ncbi:hypothetical protein Golob_003690 [Gossypium lobatum]|uniref:Uncharacterized protein n=1 Tax=Gossypium lobatum TaxID=34289 RepID=A0A7J8MZK4_9ROSI|nr:hypothetical protein [Gossypium lobatum]